MSFLLYGCYGYTGRLIAHEALRQGLRPLLAGRDAEKTKAFAQSTGLDYVVFPLENPAEINSAIREFKVVLNAAGPFSKTFKPMADACIRNGVHYLDITGEISVFESLAGMDAAAKKAAVMLLPGVGFDVVPSDCLALKLKQAMPDATKLRLGFLFRGGGYSHGTAKSAAESFGLGSMVRRKGKLVSIKEGSLVRHMDFGKGPKKVVATPWGDVSTAWYSTGIPDIEVYFQFPDSVIRMMKLAGFLGGLLQTAFVQKLLANRIKKLPEGPTAEELEKGKSFIIGEAENASGKIIRAKMITPQGYRLTAMTSVSALKHVLEGKFRPGFATPSGVFGAGFAEESGNILLELYKETSI